MAPVQTCTSRRHRAAWLRGSVLCLSATGLLLVGAPRAFSSASRPAPLQLRQQQAARLGRSRNVALSAAQEAERLAEAEAQPEPRKRGGMVAAAVAAALALAAPQLAPQGDIQFSAPARAEVQEVLNPEEQQVVNLFERNTKGVVFITNEKLAIEAATMSPVEVPAGSGSGWVYDDEGHIITNFHVIQGASALNVRFIDGTEVPARVVGADPGTDVAVLEVAKKPAMMKPLTRGVSASLKVGQEVFAIGNPFGLDHTLTRGIVSGVGRTIQSIGGRPIQGAIQTDASINPGNSGGPLLNSNGKVVGMNTVIISPSGASAGVGFAIPSDTVSARAQSILKYGYVKRPSLGLYLAQDVSAPVGPSGKGAGVLVAGLQRSSAAGRAGIRTGDVLTKVADRKTTRVNDVYAELDEHEPGEQIKVELLRRVGPQDEQGRAEYKSTEVDIVLAEAQAEL